MADLNFVGPVLRVELEGIKGNRMRLHSWLPSYQVKGYEEGVANVADFPYLTDLTVAMKGTSSQLDRGSASGSHDMNVTLSIPYEEFLEITRTFLDCFADGAKLVAQLGYSQEGGLLSEEFVGNVTQQNVSLSAESVAISLQAPGISHSMRTRDGSFSAIGTSIFDMLVDIVTSHGSELYYLSAGGKEVVMDSVPDFLPKLNDKPIVVLQDTDYAILRRLIDVFAGYNMYRRGHRVVIYDLSIEPETDIPVFSYRGHVDPTQNLYPILDFSNANAKSAMLQAVQLITTKDVDLDTKEDVSDEVRHGDPDLGIVYTRPQMPSDEFRPAKDDAAIALEAGSDNPATAENAAKSSASAINATSVASTTILGAAIGYFRSDNAGKKLPVPSNDPAGRGKQTNEKRRATAASSLQSEWTTLGNPFFLPGMKAILNGCSIMFDGLYEITEVTHTIGTGGYTTRLKGHTFGTSVTESDGTEPAPSFKESDAVSRARQLGNAVSEPPGPVMDGKVPESVV